MGLLKWALFAGVALLVGYLIWRALGPRVRTMLGAEVSEVSVATGRGEVEMKKGGEKKGVNDEVKEVSGDDVPKLIQNEKDLVIMVYAPWCGYCKKMMPEFSRAAALDGDTKRGQRKRRQDQSCLWARLNGDAFPDTAEAMGVGAFPTTLHFVNGNLVKTIPGAVDAEQLLTEVEVK